MIYSRKKNPFPLLPEFMRESSAQGRDWITAVFRDERVKPRFNETHYIHARI